MIRYRPGRELKVFEIRSKTVSVDSKGRVMKKADPADRDACIALRFKGMLSAAGPDEIDRWSQMQHPITHTITSRKREARRVKPEQVLILDSREKERRFYVQGVSDPGELGIYTIIYAQERTDAEE